MRLWIGLALIAICAGTSLAQSDEYEWYGLEDGNFQSHEYQYQASAENKDEHVDIDKEQHGNGNESEEKVNEDIENFYRSLENEEEKPDELNDYQIEDNRSEPKDEQNMLPRDKQKDLEDAPVEVQDTDADFNESPVLKDTNQSNDDTMYDMDENSKVEPFEMDKENIERDILEEEKDINKSGESYEDLDKTLEDENKPVEDTVKDQLNNVFDFAENAEEIQENIESIEHKNQLVNDLAGQFGAFGNEGDEQGDVQREIESFDEFQQSIVKNSDNEKLDDEVDNESYEEKSSNEDELNPKDVSVELEQPLNQHSDQNDGTDEEQIVEENIDSESVYDKNEEHSEQDIGNNSAPKDGEFAAAETYDEMNSSEGTIDEIDDLDDDLKNLFETWEKLQEDDTIREDDNGNILDYEEKYNKPYREGNILSVREYNDDSVDGGNDNSTSVNGEDVIKVEDKMKNYSEMDKKIENHDVLSLDMAPVQEKKYNNEGLVENDAEFYRNVSSASDYIDENGEKEKDSSSSSSVSSNDVKYESADKYAVDTNDDNDVNRSKIKTIDVDNLTPEQYDDMMKQFTIVHSHDLDITDNDKVAPIHMIVTADEAVIIESPDYPNNYPTNNVIDYFFDGLGTGIEFNITDFSVNGILGDYLLVKPGGIDASGTDGLVFSYHLNEKRQYRFLDVDSLFVRFFAHPGVAMFKGYQFSVKMISPPKEDEELQPEPEPLLPPPATLTVTLGGTSVEKFDDIQEDFRQLIADMATMYINANGIILGLNNTSETAQITKITLCNVHWPGYESCVAVTFGVPLMYEDDQPARLNVEDLNTMWNTYVQMDPFASRLRRMGITEFESPNDRRVLIVWLVIAAGVLISMAMLALALWRFSCFEDYTRMAAYSDTDSINEKRVLDMYPTPHQSFPALYAEQQLKWDDDKFDDTTRVDMGGYANKSYVRDDLLDSDEDIVTTPRDRNSFSPGDIYQV